MFVWLCDKVIENNFKTDNILDVGYASGDFLEYFSKRFPKSYCSGIEFDKKLVEISNKRRNRNYQIFEGDANKIDKIDSNSRDLIL